MTALPQKKKFTPAEYLALEEKAEFRSEYENGEIIAMAGGSFNHVQITSNVVRSLGNQLSGKCSVLPTDMKVWVEKREKFYYPDITIVCGKPQFHQNRTDTITNPQILIEVLSKSTEAKDRTGKFWSYQLLDSFQEYILVSQDKAAVEQFVRQADGSWRYLAVIGEESVLRLMTVEAELNLKEVYQAVDFETEEDL
ncbi:MAG: Uma2 family endonuclease [Acidobacteriota bacterium]|nr:Uma2 family endonuclease [Acidobacteriota bacterium]